MTKETLSRQANAITSYTAPQCAPLNINHRTFKITSSHPWTEGRTHRQTTNFFEWEFWLRWRKSVQQLLSIVFQPQSLGANVRCFIAVYPVIRHRYMLRFTVSCRFLTARGTFQYRMRHHIIWFRKIPKAQDRCYDFCNLSEIWLAPLLLSQMSNFKAKRLQASITGGPFY